MVGVELSSRPDHKHLSVVKNAEIAHPYMLAAIVAGVIGYLLWQRAQTQAAQQAAISSLTGPSGGTLFGSSSGVSSSGTSDIPNIVVTPGNLNPSSS
jgi:uncharacterized protein YaaW (UPF0174 family)